MSCRRFLPLSHRLTLRQQRRRVRRVITRLRARAIVLRQSRYGVGAVR